MNQHIACPKKVAPVRVRFIGLAGFLLLTRRALSVVALLFLVGAARAGDDLESAFRQPSATARPGVWWHWMGCNVSKEGITRDLEEFKAAGISSATIFGMSDSCVPWAGHIENSPNDGLLAFTDPWWQLVRHAAAEGKRLGIDIGLHNCPGYTSTGGPWITPELAMQQIFQSQTAVDGGTTFHGILPRPTIDPRGDAAFPMINKQTGVLEKPIVEGRTSYWRDIAVLAVPAEGVITKEQVIDLTAKMDATGKLEWSVPAGKWIIYRFGHTTMGSLTQPNQWEIMGLECDKMSEKAVTFHLQHVIGQLKQHLGPLLGTGLKHVLLDSYEAGTPSWTPLMPEEFSQRRSYDLKAFLPTFAGRVVASEAETQKFRNDFNRTIADLYRDKLFATMSRLLREANVMFNCEPYGGPFDSGEVSAHVHRVMTEFWNGAAFGGGPMDGLLNAGEGKRHNILEAEAFTGAPDHSQWSETPEMLKPVGDGAYCAGINRFILHTNPHQPWPDHVKPGMTMGQWGTHFGRTQTWWQPGKAWLAYLARCQALLQWGAPAATGGFAMESATEGIQVRNLHRSAGTQHVFFLANTSQHAGTASCVFQVGGLQPELWNPVTGEMRALTDFQSSEQETTLSLDFAPTQSWFVVFRRPASKPELTKSNFPRLSPIATVTGAWQVTFDPKWGGPAETVNFQTLEDWTARPEAGIRYYSGSALYSCTFDLLQPVTERTFLDLGKVNHLARVWLNHQDLGVVWCSPWGVSIPRGLLKAKANKLEIVVTNVWANRLIGDEQEPADCQWSPGFMGHGGFLKRFPDWFAAWSAKGAKRPSSGRYTFTTWNYFTKDSKLIPSGLLGPVRVMKEHWLQTPPPVQPRSRSRVSGQSSAAFESDLPPAQQLLPVASVEELGAILSTGNGTNADPIHNGTTRNGSGGAETLDDGKTFRVYGKGNSLIFHLDLTKRPQGYELAEIRSFAGHSPARSGQSYEVWVSSIAEPDKFVRVASASIDGAGGSTQLRVPVKAEAVAAVRLDFADGPLGYNVYREICLVAPSSKN